MVENKTKEIKLCIRWKTKRVQCKHTLRNMSFKSGPGLTHDATASQKNIKSYNRAYVSQPHYKITLNKFFVLYKWSAYLDNSTRVKTNHVTDTSEGRVLLLIVSYVPQWSTPERWQVNKLYKTCIHNCVSTAHVSNKMGIVSNFFCWCNNFDNYSLLLWLFFKHVFTTGTLVSNWVNPMKVFFLSRIEWMIVEMGKVLRKTDVDDRGSWFD